MPLRDAAATRTWRWVEMLGVAIVAVIPVVLRMIVLLLLGLVALHGTASADRAAILRAILGRGDNGHDGSPR